MAYIPSYYEGLLSEDDMSSLRNQSLASGLLSAGAAFSRAGAPSLMPQGSGFSEALQGFNQGYQGQVDSALQNMLRATQVQELVRKQKQAQQMQQALAGAYTATPQAISMATGKGSQLEMLSRPEFGGDMAKVETVDALRGNLPTTKALDFNKLVNIIGQFDPVEAAKLMVKTDTTPEAIKTFNAFQKMSPAEQRIFAEYKKISSPNTTNTFTLTEKGLNEIDSDRVKEFSAAAASARTFSQSAGVVNNLLKGKQGGDVVVLGTKLAKDLGFNTEQVSAQDLAQSIATRGAVGIRQPGSGSTSDIEFKAYLGAFPSLSNSESGREFMTAGAEAFAKRNALLADKARELYKAGKYSDTQIAQYDNSLGPVIDQKKLDELSKQIAPGKPQRRSF